MRPSLRFALLLELPVLLAFLAGCQTAVPSLFLQMEDPTGMEPTQLRVTLRVQGVDTTTVVRPETPGAPLPSPQTMRIVLPDAAVGHTAQLTIEALKDGNVVGTALASAAVVQGAETQVSVALAPQTSCPGGVCGCNGLTCPSGCCVGDVCTTPNVDACGVAGAACAACPAGLADRCTDGLCRCGGDLPCAEGYLCEAGACVPTSVPACTRAEDCVTPPGQCFQAQGTCGEDGQCTYAPKPSTESCSDGDSCTDADACNGAGACVGTARVCNTPDNSCQEATGTCLGGECSYATRPEGSGCNDGDACTTNDACSGTGACEGDAIACSTPPSQCHQATGTCSGGTCSYAFKGSGSACNDGNACTTGDVCNGSGSCGGSAVACNSPPSQCHQATGTCSGGTCSYAFKTSGTACNDGNACTTGDVCNGSGSCGGSAMACNNPPSQCYQSAGTCSGGNCSYTPKGSGTACNDGNACTTGDVCNGSGTCGGSAVACNSPPSQCHQATGTCSGGTCSYAFKGSGTACNDGNACTTGDVCNGSGSCGGSAMACNNPPSQCYQSAGTCSGGSCSYTPKGSGSACNDGNACTTGDVCNGSGTCGGSAVACNSPPSQCHQATGTCSGGSCTYALKSVGSACNDGNACTQNDACTAAGACVGSNSPDFTSCGLNCNRCVSGVCQYGCNTSTQQCCWGTTCKSNSQACGIEP